MAAVQTAPSPLRLRKRSFFFALSADQREFSFPGSSKERLSLRMLSLGFGARDEVHVLEAEGAKGDWEKAKMVAQTTAMLGVQPSMPAVALTNTVLTPPVTFRLRSGPGPLYVSGSHLESVDEAGLAAPVMAATKSMPKTLDEPALKKANVSSGVFIAPVSVQPASMPFTLPTVGATVGAKDSAPAMFTAKFLNQRVSMPSSTMPAVSRTMPAVSSSKPAVSSSKPAVSSSKPAVSSSKPAVSSSKPPISSSKPPISRSQAKVKTRLGEMAPEMRQHLDKLKQQAKAKILESVGKGVKLSNVQVKFERFLKHCHKITDPYLVTELWKWRQSMK